MKVKRHTIRPVWPEQRGAGVTVNLAFRLAGRFGNGLELRWQEGEVAHDPLQLPVEGAGLQRGEQGVEFGEVGAQAGFLGLDRFDDGREPLLDFSRW
jgi:hypothetical protein